MIASIDAGSGFAERILDGAVGSRSAVTAKRSANNPTLTRLDGLENLVAVGGQLVIRGNAALANLDGLARLERLAGNLTIEDNPRMATQTARQIAHRLQNKEFTGNVVVRNNGTIPVWDFDRKSPGGPDGWLAGLSNELGGDYNHFEKASFNVFPSIIFALLFPQPGATGAVYIDDINFKKLPDTFVPVSSPDPEPQAGQRSRALWAWDTPALLQDGGERRTFFEFCGDRRVQDVFLQALYHEDRRAGKIALESPQAFRAFLRQAHERGIQVHALDGEAHLALAPFHPDVLRRVRGVVQFNEESLSEERFDGIRLMTHQ